MNDIEAIACGAGLRDGLNPCIFMTCAVFIAHGLWLDKRSQRMGWLRPIFVLAYAASTVLFDFGPAQVFLFHKGFILAAKVLYFILGLGALGMGVFFLKDWISLRRGLGLVDRIDKKTGSLQDTGIIALLVTVVLAAALNAMATLWPINNYVMILGNESLLRGQWQVGVFFLGNYILFSMWPLWFVWAFLSVKGLRPSLLKIVCAAVFFTASSTMVLLFK